MGRTSGVERPVREPLATDLGWAKTYDAEYLALAKLLADLGGSLESFHFAFGEEDAYVIADVPDNVTAAAIGMTVGASGAASTKTVVLLTPEEVDEAAKRSIAYRPPGK